MLRAGVMALLFAIGAMIEAKTLSSLSSLANGDVWWHLRTGIWILQSHSLPHAGLFSQTAERPWVDASWGFDLLTAVGYRILGLRIVPVSAMLFRSGLAVITFVLAGGLRGKFWRAALLSLVAQYVLGIVPLGSACFSILFFGIELLLLLESRRKGTLLPVRWLPLIFLVWANCDDQFVYGILLVALFLATVLLQNLRSGHSAAEPGWSAFSARNAAALAAVCGLATAITPYFVRPYSVFFQSLTTPAGAYLPDLHAMGFRRPQDYLLMLLTMAAFLALGLRRSRDSFKIVLLIACAILAFHAQRNTWLAALAATAVIGEAFCESPAEQQESQLRRGRSTQGMVAAGLLAAILIVATFVLIPRSPQLLMAKVAETFPVAACNYIRNQQLPQPLFNAYEWGGFLAWFLPDYPVTIDSRPGLYDDDFVVQYFKTMNAEVPYASFSAMNQAGTLLLPRHSVMGEALSTLPSFRVAYSDDVAIVLIRP